MAQQEKDSNIYFPHTYPIADKLNVARIPYLPGQFGKRLVLTDANPFIDYVEGRPAIREYADGKVRIFESNEGAPIREPRTEIDVLDGTVIVNHLAGKEALGGKYYGVKVRKGRGIKPIFATSIDYSKGFNTYKFIDSKGVTVGYGEGKDLALGLAVNLGIDNPELMRVSGIYWIDQRVLIRLRLELLTMREPA